MPEETIIDEEEFQEEIPEEAEALPIEAANFQVTIDDLPELSGLNIGDTLTLSIQDVSEDGNVFTLAMAEELAEEVPPVGLATEEIGGAL